jgi:predicted phosphate transport protein (TIGR00153 family)
MAKNPIVRALQAVVRVLQPPSEKFYDLLEQAGQNMAHGAELLQDLLTNYTSVTEKVAAVKAAEQEGDRITQEILRRLDRQFVTPMDREDISHLAQCLDDVLDLCEGVAVRLSRFAVDEITQPAKDLGEVLVKCASEVHHVVTGMRHLGGDHSHHWRSIHLLENQADEIERAALAGELQRAKDGIASGTWQEFAHAMIYATQWGEIYERLERATDRCEDAANVLETLSAKYG